MWNYIVRIYKNVLWLYVLVMIAFSWQLLMSHIPDKIYVQQGDSLNLSLSVPVTVRAQEEELQAEAVEVASISDSDAIYEDCELDCYLFGFIPIKTISVQVVEEESVYASGRVIGIYEQTDGVLVLKTATVTDVDGETVAPAENLVQSGDYIYSANDTSITSKEELVEYVGENGTTPITLGILRDGESISVTVTPVESEDGAYLMGIWVKDDMAGIGTLTYYQSDGSFGALGHGISDGETGQLLSVSVGRIYAATLIGITKGEIGTPGQLEGVITYNSGNLLGTIESNSTIGIYGTLDAEDFARFSQTDTCYEIGYKQEITVGSACILSDISGSVEAYEIEITDVNYDEDNSNKSIHFTVTDEELIDLTGGIVQGMSGSPIIQDGKLIGAVTHVMVSDPLKGYGIFIEYMLG